MENGYTRAEERKRKRTNRTNIWLIIGAIVLIVLLLLWLTMADFAGDTDVAATVSPIITQISGL